MTSDTPRIGILGGGIVGIIASLLLRDFDPIIISPDLGGSWNKGGLKLLKYHPEIEALFKQYDVMHMIFNVTGAVWWNGTLYELGDVPEEVQKAHYIKTRGTMDGYDGTCMNNKAGIERCFEFDYTAFINKAAENLTQFQASVKQIDILHDQITIQTDERAVFDFDYVLTSIPLPQLCNMNLNFDLPKAEYRWLSMASFEAMVRSPWHRMYIYTPEKNGIHRISRTGLLSRIWTMETTDEVSIIGNPGLKPLDNSEVDEYWTQEIEKVKQILPDAVYKRHMGMTTGHLLPLVEELKYPDRILPIGRFASWKPRETVDVVVSKVLEWKKELWT